MRYFANPSTPAIREAMTSGLLSCIVTPKQGNRIPANVEFCADNGAFGKGYPGDAAWWEWLRGLPARERCAFAVAPDVPFDNVATRAKSTPWLARIRGLGIAAAYAAQDGDTVDTLPWPEFGVLFLGGSTEWKLGEQARDLVGEAKLRGRAVHMGRVNSGRRLRYAQAIGCDSADGTKLAFGPDVNLPVVLGWLRVAAHGTQGMLL